LSAATKPNPAAVCPDQYHPPAAEDAIYELLPTVDGGLPKRLSDRTIAADLTARLNHDPVSSLRGQINQHTNPSGIISDTAVQKVILNSLSDGALRQLAGRQQALDRCSRLLSDFYGAVQYVFADAWAYHTPRTSRLVHGAGVVAMGYVMEELHRRGAETDDEFRRGLGSLVGRTAWTAGEGFGRWTGGIGRRSKYRPRHHDPRPVSSTLSARMPGRGWRRGRGDAASETGSDVEGISVRHAPS
jgi:hypothetical protein